MKTYTLCTSCNKGFTNDGVVFNDIGIALCNRCFSLANKTKAGTAKHVESKIKELNYDTTLLSEEENKLFLRHMKLKKSLGRLAKHFKGGDYLIMEIAEHTETGDYLVIYKALYGDHKVYARPIDMFLSPVDKKKYPDVNKEFRFEF